MSLCLNGFKSVCSVLVVLETKIEVIGFQAQAKAYNTREPGKGGIGGGGDTVVVQWLETGKITGTSRTTPAQHTVVSSPRSAKVLLSILWWDYQSSQSCMLTSAHLVELGAVYAWHDPRARTTNTLMEMVTIRIATINLGTNYWLIEVSMVITTE
jgi:hypothetical protein